MPAVIFPINVRRLIDTSSATGSAVEDVEAAGPSGRQRRAQVEGMPLRPTGSRLPLSTSRARALVHLPGLPGNPPGFLR